MLEKFITSALIIDDSEKEIEKLGEYLNSRDIWTMHCTPDDLDEQIKKKTTFNNRKIIFLDLSLDDKIDITNNISKIKMYFKELLGKDFGSYGIVLWTKHTEDFDKFKEKIYNAESLYSVPLFVIQLDKMKYILENDFEGIIEDIEKELKADVASSFFMQWNMSVNIGSDRTITYLYDLFETLDEKKKYLESLLCEIALSYTGISRLGFNDDSYLQKDLVKSLMNTLQHEITENYVLVRDFLKNPEELVYNPEDSIKKNVVYAKINSLLLLDKNNLKQDYPLPGNIYEITNEASSLYIKKIYKRNNEIDIDEDERLKNIIKKRVCIEITPPCDFSNNKNQKMSRLLGGLQMDYDRTIIRDNDSPFKTDSFYKPLHPLYIDGYEKPQMILFDFYRFQTMEEDELKDASNYKIILKAKDNLFADILQKFSSHIARLGISALHPS